MSGDDKTARDLFALAVRLDPKTQLVADEAVAPQLQQARAELTGAKRVSLDVDVRPAGARIFVDGELRGQHSEVPAGKHLMKVERAGFYPYAEILEIAPKKPVKASITLAATPTATSLNQIIAGASEEVGKGGAGKNVSTLAQKFSLDRVLIGSVRSLEEGRVSLVLSLVDAPKKRVIASKTSSLVADGTDADQIEADTQNTARKLISADEEEPAAATAATAAPSTEVRKVAIPGAAPAKPATADEPGLVAHERKPIVPASETSSDRKVQQPADAPAPASKEDTKKKQDAKKKSKSIKDKTGTEGWDDD